VRNGDNFRTLSFAIFHILWQLAQLVFSECLFAKWAYGTSRGMAQIDRWIARHQPLSRMVCYMIIRLRR
jgi:hypothetical protein